MKRFKEYLSEKFVTATKHSGTYVEFFVNPDRKELKSTQDYNESRGYITRHGDMYVWNPNMLHGHALQFLAKDGVLDHSLRIIDGVFGVTVHLIGTDVYIGESVNTYSIMSDIRKHFKKAEKKNPQFKFILENVLNNEM